MTREISLIPPIIIGKRYLWKRCLAEVCCPHCGLFYGEQTNDAEFIITIEGSVKDYGGMRCSRCHKPMNGEFEGWYTATVEEYLTAIPYPQLSELEGEDYEVPRE